MTQEDQEHQFEAVATGPKETILIPRRKGSPASKPPGGTVTIEGQSSNVVKKTVDTVAEKDSDAIGLSDKVVENSGVAGDKLISVNMDSTVRYVKHIARQMQEESRQEIPVTSETNLPYGSQVTTVDIKREDGRKDRSGKASVQLRSQITIDEPTSNEGKNRKILNKRLASGFDGVVDQLTEAKYQAVVEDNAAEGRNEIWIDPTGENKEYIVLSYSREDPGSITMIGPQATLGVHMKADTKAFEAELNQHANVYGIVLDALSEEMLGDVSKGQPIEFRSQDKSIGRRKPVGTIDSDKREKTGVSDVSVSDEKPVGKREKDRKQRKPKTSRGEAAEIVTPEKINDKDLVDKMTVKKDLEWIDNLDPRDIPRPLDEDAKVRLDDGSIISDGDPNSVYGVDLMRVDHDRNSEGVITSVAITRFGRFVKGDVQPIDTLIRQEYDSENLNSVTEQNPIDHPLIGVNKDIGPAIRTDGSNVWLITRSEDDGVSAIWRNGLTDESSDSKIDTTISDSQRPEAQAPQGRKRRSKRDRKRTKRGDGEGSTQVDQMVVPAVESAPVEQTPVETFRQTQRNIVEIIDKIDDGDATEGDLVTASGRFIEAYSQLGLADQVSNRDHLVDIAGDVRGTLDTVLAAHNEPANPITDDMWNQELAAITGLLSQPEDEVSIGQIISQLGPFIDALDRLPTDLFDQVRDRVSIIIEFVNGELENLGVEQ